MSVEQVSGSAWAECPNGVESAFLGIAPYKRLSKAVRFDHLLGKVPNSLVAKLAGVSTARIAERRKQLGT